MTQTSVIETLKSSLNAGGEHIGDLFWWSLSDAEVPCARLSELWRTAGLDSDALCEIPSPMTALRRAARDAQNGQEAYLVRTAAIANGELILAVVEEKRDGAGNVELTQVAQVAANLDSGAVRCDPHPFAQEIASRYSIFRERYNADDVRKSILRILRDSQAVTVRDGGGVYWIPPAFASVPRQLSQVVTAIGFSTAAILPVHRTAEAQAALSSAAKGSLECELAEIRDEIEAFGKDAEHVRPSTLTRRLEAFEALKARAAMYRTVLAVEVDDLDARIEKLTARVETLLTEKLSGAASVEEAA